MASVFNWQTPRQVNVYDMPGFAIDMALAMVYSPSCSFLALHVLMTHEMLG